MIKAKSKIKDVAATFMNPTNCSSSVLLLVVVVVVVVFCFC